MDQRRSGVPRTGCGALLLQHAKVPDAFSVTALTQIFYSILFPLVFDVIGIKFYFLTEITCPSPKVHAAFWAGAQKDAYQYRDTISIECYPGYTVSGPSIITCGSDGRWSPRLPRCTRMIGKSSIVCVFELLDISFTAL